MTARLWNADSPFASSAVLAGARYPRHADLSNPEAFKAALRTRSYKNELILFSFDFCGVSEALSLVLTLRAASFEHFAPLSDGAETCDALHSAAVARGLDASWPCYYSSWPRDHAGWDTWGTAAGCVSAAREAHYCVIEQLWATRYHVSARILAAGVNLLHIDTDAAILSDPYAMLKSPPMAGQNLVILPETPANGGMWYAQNTTDGTGAQWVIAEVARRTLAVIALSLPPGRKAQPPFDQAFYGDVLWTASDSGTPHWAAACEHPRLRASHLCPENVTHGARSMRWLRRQKVAPPNLAAAGSLVPLVPLPDPRRRPRRRGRGGGRGSRGAQAARGGRLDLYGGAFETPCIEDRPDCRRALLKFAELRVPGRSRVESAMTAPPWLFPSAWKAQQLGTYARSPPAVSLVHLLGVRCRWCESSEDVDHGAKWEWQHLAGFWPEAAYTLATPLNLRAAAIGAGWPASAPQLPTPSSAVRSLSAAEEAEGARGSGASTLDEPLPTRIERHCRKKGRARLLYADRPALRLSPQSLALRRVEVADDGGALARQLVRRLLVLASLMGRMAVLPSFNCSAPWIKKRIAADGQLVVADLRVVVTEVSRARPVVEQRCAPCNVQFACREHVLSEAQHAAAERALASASGSGGRRPPVQRLKLPLMKGGSADGSAATLKSPAAIETDERRSAASDAVVDVAALWQQLGRAGMTSSPSLPHNHRRDSVDQSAVIELDDDGDLPTIGATNGCTLDATLLRDFRPLAARVAMMHCGVADVSRPLRSGCARSDAAAVAAELSKWERGVHKRRRQAERQGSSGTGGGAGGCERLRSPLADRLGARCGDLLCSADSCDALAIESCAQRMRWEQLNMSGIALTAIATSSSSAAADAVTTPTRTRSLDELRDRCTAWVRQLPPHLGPRCDVFSGQCAAPPDAHPEEVVWPSVACLHVAGGRAICEQPSRRTPQGRQRARGAPDYVKDVNHGRPRTCGSCVLVPPRRAAAGGQMRRRAEG